MYLIAGGKQDGMDPTDFLPGWWEQDLADKEESGSGPSPEQLRQKISVMFAGLGGVDTSGSS